MTTFTPTCPDLGVWRAWLDHEDTSPALEAHLDSCTACTAVVAELRQSAATATQALQSVSATHAPSATDIAIARERLAWRQRQGEAAPTPVASSTAEQPPTLVGRIPTPWRVA